MFTLELCRNKKAYVVRPNKRTSLDFDSIKSNFNVIIETPKLLVVRNDYELLIHKNGELWFKHFYDVKEVKKMASSIYRTSILEAK